MDKTLTIRIDKKQQQALVRAAEQLGKTVSELIREILQDALNKPPLSTRTRYLKGRLRLKRSTAGSFSRTVKEHNWRS